MYELAVVCLFKNESNSILEWIEHYFYHGANHIYLINDDSSDNSIDLIKNYIIKGQITLFEAKGWKQYLGRQREMYNEFVLPLVKKKEMRWLLICDMDEYVWSPLAVDLKEILKQCENFSQIQMNHTLFGSSGHIMQPKSIVKYFTKRRKHLNHLENMKYFVNSDFEFSSLNVHHASYVNDDDEEKKKHFRLLDDYFKLNHYKYQSFEFWKNIKCTRGDADHYLIRKEMEFFENDNLNEVEDRGLWDQNKFIKK
jgi:hypothetical protein